VSDIFEEVEEKLREDKLQVWWDKYGMIAIGAAVGLVLFVGLYYGVVSPWRASQSASAGERFAAIQEQALSDPVAAQKALTDFQKSAGSGYKALAEMERAGLMQAQGDLSGAITAFDNAAKLAQQPVLKQSAQLRAAYIAADTENFPALEARLRPLIDTRGAFSYLARELLAVEAYEAGLPDRARTEFTYLETALDAPDGVRQRAQSFITVLGPAAPAAGLTAPAPAIPAPAPASSKTGEKK
jgi:hypothetical protein